jgi:opacity protein-like surface antigen
LFANHTFVLRLLFLPILLFSFITVSAQTEVDRLSHDFYLSVGNLSSFATTISAEEEYKSQNLIDFGVYCGNKFYFNERGVVCLEFFYLNNQVVLARNDDRRFELHQNIGASVKPGVILGRHSFYSSCGITAVYVFDKDEVLGNQYDRFDQSMTFGVSYEYELTSSISMSLGCVYSKFHSISHFTSHTLIDFTMISTSIVFSVD